MASSKFARKTTPSGLSTQANTAERLNLASPVRKCGPACRSTPRQSSSRSRSQCVRPSAAIRSGGRPSVRQGASRRVRRSAGEACSPGGREHAMSKTILPPFQPEAMTPAQLAAISYLARYSGHTHQLYAYQLRRWVRLVRDQRAGSIGRDPAGPRRALHSSPRRARSDAVLDQHDDARSPGVLSGSPTSTASSRPSRPSMPGCRRSTRTSRAPRDWTASS